MKKVLFKNCLLILAVIFILNACNDPIFYAVAKEVKPIEPRIGGGPTNFADFKNEIYVASRGNLWKYSVDTGKPEYENDADGFPKGKYWEWNKVSGSPKGNFQQLASTKDYLYAITYKDSEKSTPRSLWGFKTVWEELKGETGSYNTIQYIYSEDNILFIGAANSDSYAVFYIDETLNLPAESAIQALKNIDPDSLIITGEICGTAYDQTYYYICTKKDGIYRISNFSIGAELINNSKKDLAGMINIGPGKNLAISDYGNLYSITLDAENPFKDLGISIDNYDATGALGIWINPNNPPNMLLLAGRKEKSTSSGYTYGYVEIKLDLSQSDGIENSAKFSEPGESAVSSIIDGDYERFLSTIGKYPVNHIFQAPNAIDKHMTLFASTQKNGVWSYRKRDGEHQWNAER